MLRLVRRAAGTPGWKVLAEVRRQRQAQLAAEMAAAEPYGATQSVRPHPGPPPPPPPYYTEDNLFNIGAAPSQTPSPPPPPPPPLQPLPPTPAALQVLKLLQAQQPQFDLPAALAESSFTPSALDLASLLDLLLHHLPHHTLLPLQTLIWSLRHPSFSPSSHLLPPRLSPLLPPPVPPAIDVFLSDAHLFWLHPDLPLPHTLLDPLVSLYCFAAPTIHECIELLNLILHKGGPINVVHLNKVLQSAVQRPEGLTSAQWLFSNMRRLGHPPNVPSYNILIGAHYKASDFKAAMDLFEEMTINGIAPNEATYLSIIAVAAKSGKQDKALEYLTEMKYNGYRPRDDTYAAVINGFCSVGDHVTASRLLKEVRNEGISLDDHAHSALIATLAQATGMSEADTHKVLAGNVLDGDSTAYGG